MLTTNTAPTSSTPAAYPNDRRRPFWPANSIVCSVNIIGLIAPANPSGTTSARRRSIA